MHLFVHVRFINGRVNSNIMLENAYCFEESMSAKHILTEMLNTNVE